METNSLISHNIERFGLHVQAVFPTDEGEPGWAYSIGLFHTYGHPELVTSGLPPRTAGQCFNEIGRRAAKGLKLADGSQLDDLLTSTVAFKAIPPDLFGDEVGLATRFYGKVAYPLLQLVWQDVEHRFPWEQGYCDDPPQDLLFMRGGTRGHGRKRIWA